MFLSLHVHYAVALCSGCPHLGLFFIYVKKVAHARYSLMFSLLSLSSHCASLSCWSWSLVCCRLCCCSLHIDIVLTNNTHCTSFSLPFLLPLPLRPRTTCHLFAVTCADTRTSWTFWHFRFLSMGPGIFFACLVICLFVFQ